MKMMVFLVLISACLLSGNVLTSQLQKRAYVERLGAPPSPQIVRALAADHRYIAGQFLAMKVIFYFGGLVEEWKRNINIKPEYDHMFRWIETAVMVNPYCEDAYYLLQGVFTWDDNRAADVNRLLAYGMKYRTWDYRLPFFAGFNAGFFLKDYDSASRYMEKAALLSGNAGLAGLAAKFYYQAGRFDAAVSFLNQMIAGAATREEADQYRLRKKVLVNTERIRQAVKAYREKFGQLPGSVAELVRTGFLPDIPEDPLGREYLIDPKGNVWLRASAKGDKISE